MRNEKCGIYRIFCSQSKNFYIGSSKQIHNRWSQHRHDLRRGKSHCVYLQHAWTRYGEALFEFSVVEECGADELEAREQFYIDALKPRYNSITDIRRRYGAEMLAKRAASIRARAALITHCPHGHEYTAENSYVGRKGERICRTCNKERVSGIYASETPEQREARRRRAGEYHNRTRDVRLEKQREYSEANRDTKRAYDKANLARAAEHARIRRLSETPEQRERRLRTKRGGDYKGRECTPEKAAKISAALKGRTRRGPNCPNGHPYDEVNSRVTKYGKVECKTCRNERKRATRLAKAA